MDLVNSKTRLKDEKSNDLEERILRRCRLAQELEDKGHYPEARQALGELFPVIGELPRVDGLSPLTQAEVLLRVGAISGYIGGDRGIDGAQEYAQNLISKATRIFEAEGVIEREADARIHQAICYYRIGSYDEGRVVLYDLLDKISGKDNPQEGRAWLHIAVIDITSGRFHDAKQALIQAAPFYEASSNLAARGRFHNNLALVFRNLGEIEKNEDYIDRALDEYAGASLYFQEAGHTRHAARVENNLGYLLYTLKRYNEAHQHLEAACRMFIDLKDSASVAQVNESRAQVFLAQGRNAEAETVSFGAVHSLEHGGQQTLLAEALLTHGTALARLGRDQQARAVLNRAAEVAEQVGDLEAAGRAHLVIIEELQSGMQAHELADLYESADRLLEDSRNSKTLARLRDCARVVITALMAQPGTQTASEDFKLEGTLYDELNRYEGELIQRAWERAGGKLTRTAHLLGITHQGLRYILEGRQKDRIPGMTAPRVRRRSIFGTAKRRSKLVKK